MIHLHRHSEYSLLDGTGTAQQYADRAKQLGQEALALTDHASLSGILHHIKACESVGIMPIVGVEAYFRPNRLVHEKENREYWHITLLARNIVGWRSLLRLTSEAYQSGFYYKPAVDYELLKEHSAGLMCGTGCMSGYLPDRLLANDPDWKSYASRMLEIFGDDLFVEIMPNSIDRQILLNPELVNFADERGLPYVATADAHYPYEEWADTQDVMLMMATGQTLSSRAAKVEKGEDVYTMGEKSLFLSSEDEVRAQFLNNQPKLHRYMVDVAIDNTHAIANRCVPFEIDKGEKLPRAKVSRSELRLWCVQGLEDKGLEDERYLEQLQHELKILESKHVEDYFLIIGEMVRWAKENGIRVGAGRGSAAGSLVSYLAGITAIDPLAHGLLFERFLNPHRDELPDIDLDFQHNRRQDVKDHLGDVYGADHVADIVAHQTFGMRASLQGCARVFDVPYDVFMKVTETFTDATGEMNLELMYDMSPELRKFAGTYPDVWKHAQRVEGQVKAISKHAAGVVVTDRPVSDYMPTMRGNDGSTVTAWSQRAEFPIIDEYGFLKIDVLGTDGLTIQNYALDLIEKRTGSRPDLDALTAEPPTDREVLAAFGDDRTLGVFQFESRGIRGLLRQIKPTKFGDIVAANALYRPGPLEGGIAFEYGDRKNGKVPVTYWHESIRPFLEETYGLMVYQEQVMQIVQALGDFTLAEADEVRKAMTKWQSTKIKTNKGRHAMNVYEKKFVDGCMDKDIGMAEAQAIWNQILQFSIYGFNKSHSAGYAAQAYQDMWLKLKFPLEFYASLLTWETAKVPQVIREAQASGIKVLPPDVNKSDLGFSIDGDAIRFGLAAVKHVGDAAVREIVKHRPYTSLEHLQDNVEKKRCNKRVTDALTACGAMDGWGLRDDLDDTERRKREKELLGFALSAGSSVAVHRQVIAERISRQDDDAPDGTTVTLGGEVVSVREITTKRGQLMAFLDVAFGVRTWSCTLFPNTWEKHKQMLQDAPAIMARGEKDGESVIVHTMSSIDSLIEALEGEKHAGRS